MIWIVRSDSCYFPTADRGVILSIRDAVTFFKEQWDNIFYLSTFTESITSVLRQMEENIIVDPSESHGLLSTSKQ